MKAQLALVGVRTSIDHPFEEERLAGYGTDLSDDHPVSIDYAIKRALDPDAFEVTPTGGIKLFNGMVECASCHDVHNPQNGTFLRVSNTGSGLCKTCHIK